MAHSQVQFVDLWFKMKMTDTEVNVVDVVGLKQFLWLKKTGTEKNVISMRSDAVAADVFFLRELVLNYSIEIEIRRPTMSWKQNLVKKNFYRRQRSIFHFQVSKNTLTYFFLRTAGLKMLGKDYEGTFRMCSSARWGDSGFESQTTGLRKVTKMLNQK